MVNMVKKNTSKAANQQATPSPAQGFTHTTTSGRRNKLYPQMNMGKLAERCGMDRSYVARIMTGKQAGTTKALMQIAGALGVGLEDLIEGIKQVRASSESQGKKGARE